MKPVSEQDKAKWDALWVGYEQALAAEFLSTNNPAALWDRLQAARDFKLWAEGLSNE